MTIILQPSSQLNNYLKYFPVPPQKGEVKPLSEDDLMEIIDNAKPLKYKQTMLQNNYDPYDKILEEFAGYVEKLEQAAKFTKLQMSMTTSSNTSSGKKKRKERTKDNETTGLHKCKYCKKMVTHDNDDCWEKPGNVKVMKPMKCLITLVIKMKSTLLLVYLNRTKKKRKIGQLTTEVVGEIVDRDQKITPIRCLLDTGTTSCILLKPFVTRMSKYKHSSTKWWTMGGTFKTKRKACHRQT